MAGPESEQVTEQLQARIESLENKLTLHMMQTQDKSAEAKGIVAGLESQIETLENEIKANQTESMQHKPET